MTLDLILFLILSLVAIATALGMLFSRNAVYSALFLVLNFVTVAVFYLLLGAPFIAMSQITVYAGAIMVLFLFVIMLLGAESLPQAEVLPWQKPLAIVLAVALVSGSDVYLLITRAPSTAEMFARPVRLPIPWTICASWAWRCSTNIFCLLKSPPFCCWWRWSARSC